MQIVIEIPDKEFGIDINDKFQDFFSRLKAEIKEHLINNTNLICGAYELETIDMFLEAFKNAIPLPKRHGELKDELDLDLFAPSLGTNEHIYDLMAKHNIDYVNGDDEDKVRAFALDLIHSCMNVIETAPTIIEADKDRRELSVEESIKQRIAKDVEQDVKAHTASGFIQGIRSPFE